MSNTILINAEEVANILGISKSQAYKVISQLNEELKKKGYLTFSGKVNRFYFEEKLYSPQASQ